MILSESTHFFANKIPKPPMPLSFPTQNILYLESFPSTNLSDAPHILTSGKPQMSTSGHYFNYLVWLISHCANIPLTHAQIVMW